MKGSGFHAPLVCRHHFKKGFQAELLYFEILVRNSSKELIHSGWPHSGQNEIPCVFREFSLCYINFPCVIFMQKLTISSMNKGHITSVLLHAEAYKLIF